MKRATRHPVRAFLLERHMVLDDAYDIRLAPQILDECLVITHWLKESRVGFEPSLRNLLELGLTYPLHVNDFAAEGRQYLLNHRILLSDFTQTLLFLAFFIFFGER